MAPTPHHRLLLGQYLDAAKVRYSIAVQDEEAARSNVNLRPRRVKYYSNLSLHLVYADSISNRPLDMPETFDASLVAIREDIALLGIVTELLQLHQASLLRRQARAHNALQLVCMLPDEVLSLIFEVGAPTPSEQWSRDPRECPSTRWDAGQYKRMLQSVAAVCGRFRVALLSSPRCWTNVQYVLDTNDSRKEIRRLEALDTLLARSKSVPFTLNYRVQTLGKRHPSASSLQAVSSIVLPHIHRCESVNLSCDDPAVDLPILANAAVPLRALKFVEIRYLNYWGGQVNRMAARGGLSLASCAEMSLQSLTISSNISCPRTLDFALIGVNALTRLWVDANCPARDAITLLLSSPNLEHLYWDPRETRTDVDTPYRSAQTVSLSRLISLHTGFRSSSALVLNAPHLEQIHLWNGDSFDILNPDRLSFPQLRRMSCRYAVSSDRRLASFLDRHPQLVEVELSSLMTNGYIHVAPALEHLASLCAQNTAIPSLRRLSLDLRSDSSTFLPSVGNLMRNLEDLQVDLHVKRSGRQKVYQDHDAMQGFRKEFTLRVKVNPPMRLSRTWRNAWGV